MSHELLTTELYATAVIESSEDAILTKDLDGVIRSCNPATQSIFGYAPDELIGQPVRLLIPDERQAEEDDILGRLRRGERVSHFETVRVTKGGQRIGVALTISPVRDPAGVIIGASKIARDITEQQRARNVEAYLAAIVGSSEDAVISKDLNSMIQSCNPSAQRLFGYTAEELIGQSIRVLIPLERQPEEDEILERIRRGERVEHFETVRMTKGGDQLDVSLSVSPIHDASGTIVGVAKIARDITERKRLARELAAQQEWFHVTLESIGDGVIASDPEGHVTFLNAEAAALTGWSAQEAAGGPLTEVFAIISEKTGEPVENPVAQVIRSGQVFGLANHTALVRRDGTQRAIADSAAPIRDQSGRIIGVVLVFRDVTEERKAEQALIAAGRSKDEFLAVLAHELRTPIAPIMTAIELMRIKGADTPELTRLRSVMERQAKQLARLVDDLLDIGRIVSGKLTIERERVDVNQVAKQAAEMCLPAIEQRWQTLELALPDASVHIDGDYTRLVEAVGNILGNASKYTPDRGHIALTLCAESDRAVIRVRDNGLGISPDMLERIRPVRPGRYPRASESRRVWHRPGARESDRRPARRNGRGAERRLRPGERVHDRPPSRRGTGLGDGARLRPCASFFQILLVSYAQWSAAWRWRRRHS
jgi:PAS domain S-box-containing protein